MSTVEATTTLNILVPPAIAEGHRRLPDETRNRIESQITRQFLELSVIEQYKRAEIYLSDVAVALNLYPDIEATMQWLYAHGVPIGQNTEEDLKNRDAALEKLLSRRNKSAETGQRSFENS
jgi:hypothetical protein